MFAPSWVRFPFEMRLPTSPGWIMPWGWSPPPLMIIILGARKLQIVQRKKKRPSVVNVISSWSLLVTRWVAIQMLMMVSMRLVDSLACYFLCVVGAVSYSWCSSDLCWSWLMSKFETVVIVAYWRIEMRSHDLVLYNQDYVTRAQNLGHYAPPAARVIRVSVSAWI